MRKKISAKNGSRPMLPRPRVVKRGDTLSSIAAEEFHDATLWRPIAETNRIDDPLALQPGTVLSIPALTGRGAIRR